MTTSSGRPFGSSATAEVVAAVSPDGHVNKVARVAVELSDHNDAPVRFICLSSRQMGPKALQASAGTVFDQALLALRHGHRQRITFEYASGDPHRVLVQRSRGAVALVVEEDSVQHLGGEAGIASFCVAHAHCPVHVVRRTLDP